MGHPPKRERTRGIKGVTCLTTNNKFVVAEIKDGEEMVGDEAEETA